MLSETERGHSPTGVSDSIPGEIISFSVCCWFGKTYCSFSLNRRFAIPGQHTTDEQMWSIVESKLGLQWNPDQISGRLKLDATEESFTSICGAGGRSATAEDRGIRAGDIYRAEWT